MRTLILIALVLSVQRDKYVVKQNHSNEDIIQNVVNIWNLKTLNSIKKEFLNSKDSLSKSLLLNRLDVLKSSLNSSNGNKGISGKSLRFKFIDLLKKSNKLNEMFFIIETQTDGEVIRFTNYIVKNEYNTSHVIIYGYSKNEWKKIRDMTIKQIDLKDQFETNITLESKGGNSSDVTLTQFSKKPINTRYYTPLSIGEKNPLLKIIE